MLAALALSPSHADQVPPAISLRAEPFEPRNVQLLDGPFRHAAQLTADYLLTLEPDRLLSWHRKEAGPSPKAENYGGWEARGLAGHSLGHYLSGCARMLQVTGNPEFQERIDLVVRELAECQAANANGYVGAIPEGKRIFSEIARGEIRSSGFDLNGGWVPWYNIHKLFAGLIDVARFTTNAQAVVVATNLANWTAEATRNLSDAQWQRMLACEFGGMNETLADLYALTGNTNYLSLAQKFYHRVILDPLAEGRDELAGKHANTQIPKIVGAARLYELTRDPRQAISEFFWDRVTRDHTYVTGGNSQGEHFGPAGELSRRLGPQTTETCNSYNMLRLTRKLFQRDPQARYADYYERAMWNHILASLNPENGRVCYFVSLEPGGHKQYLGLHDFTCCNGTGMENHGSYNDNIYFHGRDELWVNQFVASELHWAEKGLRLRQETVFPKAGRSRIAILADKPLRLALHVRHPAWASNGFAVKLNGQTVDARFQPQTYVTVEREWQTGDVVEVELPMNLRTEAMPDNPARQAVFAGPILLAGDMGPVGSTNAVPAFVTEEPLSKSLAAADGEALNFRSWNIGKPRDAILKPFYELHDRRQAVYWDVFSAEQWQRQQLQHAAVQAAQQALEARTIDWFQPGEMQPERDHNVQGERSDAGEYSGRKLRHAVDGGWFSFDMKVDAAGTNELICTWWGSETGNRMFDILVDGQKLATQRLQNDRPGEFWEATYRIPLGYTEGKTKVSIRLQAHPGNFAGGLFGARMVRPNGGT